MIFFMASKFVFFFVMVLFVTSNVNGLRDPLKRLSFCHWLSGFKFDVVCLQELHCVSEDEVKSWFPSFSVVSSVGSNKSCGVAILFRPSYSLVDVVRDSFGRFVRARLLHADSTFDVVLLYAPNLWSGRVLFFPSLLPLLDPSVPTLLCGDFNSVMDPGRDCRNAGGQSLTDTPDILVSLFRDLSCVDVWRSCHPTQQAFTWLRPDGTRASRIDLVGCPQFPPVIFLLVPFLIIPLFLCLWTPFLVLSLVGLVFGNLIPLSCRNVIILVRSRLSGLLGRILDSFSSLLDWWDLGKARIKSLSID